MNEPAIKLLELKELVENDQFFWGAGSACGRSLEVHLRGELLLYRPFIKRVVAELCEDDFCRRVELGKPIIVADEYGLKLSAACVEEFGLSVATWYLKVTAQRSRDGRLAFFLSLHPLGWDMQRRGGLLKAEG